MDLQMCPLCDTELYRIVPEGNTFIAYNQSDGSTVPIPDDVLEMYLGASVNAGVTFACYRGGKISYRCVVPPQGPRSSRIGADHIRNPDK